MEGAPGQWALETDVLRGKTGAGTGKKAESLGRVLLEPEALDRQPLSSSEARRKSCLESETAWERADPENWGWSGKVPGGGRAAAGWEGLGGWSHPRPLGLEG